MNTKSEIFLKKVSVPPILYRLQSAPLEHSQSSHHHDMNQQDRKRAFGKAFNGTSHASSHPHRKALRSVAASSVASTPKLFYTPAFAFGSDKENKTPFFSPQDEFNKPFDDSRYLPPLPPRVSSLRGLSELQLGNGGFKRSYTTPVDDVSCDFPEQVLGTYPSVPGPVIFEDPDTAAIPSSVSRVGPLTPSALHFQGLSLLDSPCRYLPDLTFQSAININARRTSVFVMQSIDLQ
jgi:hypothetical protein